MEDETSITKIIAFSIVAVILGITFTIAAYNIILERDYIKNGYSQTTVQGSNSIVWQKK